MFRRLSRAVRKASEPKVHRKGTVHVNTGKRTESLTEDQLRHDLRKRELAIARQEKEHELRYTKSKLSHYRLVLHILNDTFIDTAGQCPCCRYFDMKVCVDECIENFHDQAFESHYFSGGDNPLSEMAVKNEGVVGTVRRMTITTHALNRAFHMTENELVSNMMSMEEELNNLQRQALTEERKLQKLMSRYTKLPEHNVFMRYSALRHMIEEACMDCMTDANVI